MIAVIFEVELAADKKEEYLALAAQLRGQLEQSAAPYQISLK